jgi:hypothetical protein
MPVASINPLTKITAPFVHPNSGKARVYLEASHPVDVFVCHPGQVGVINTVAGAQSAGILCYPARTSLDDIVTIPEGWKETGWVLVLGNPFNRHVAVYYTVLNA